MIGNIIKVSAFVLVAVVAIGFASKKASSTQVGQVLVDLTSADANYLVEEEEIHALLAESSYGNINNIQASKLNLKSLERKIESHSHIRDAEVFQDIDGNLTIKVKEHQPVARLLNRKGKDLYLSSSGGLIPESEKYTPRVVLLEFEEQPALRKTIRDWEEGEQMFSFLKHIRNDDFWMSQISYIYIKKNNEIEIYPQVTKQVVEFGTLDDFEQKLKKLMLFYKEVLPRKGWNTYQRVSLKYKNQIICE